MISEANIPNLLRCVRNNEDAPGFYFCTYFHRCGTFGCLIGNDYMSVRSIAKVDSLIEEQPCISWAWQEYGFSECPRLFFWLFARCNGRGNTKEQRLARLRKAIYYIAHKKELLYDDSGRIRETARRAEGDHFVLRSVAQAVERKERELVEA
jgi:hypothetical protein